jgi:hypothetical protein
MSTTIFGSTTYTVKSASVTFNYLIFNFDRVPDDDPTGSKHVGLRCKNIVSVVM